MNRCKGKFKIVGQDDSKLAQKKLAVGEEQNQ